jgi:nitric oxide reductase subunit B
MRAVAKYLGAVVALFVVQVALGAVTAHYTVEGQAFSASRSPTTCRTA